MGRRLTAVRAHGHYRFVPSSFWYGEPSMDPELEGWWPVFSLAVHSGYERMALEPFFRSERIRVADVARAHAGFQQGHSEVHAATLEEVFQQDGLVHEQAGADVALPSSLPEDPAPPAGPPWKCVEVGEPAVLVQAVVAVAERMHGSSEDAPDAVAHQGTCTDTTAARPPLARARPETDQLAARHARPRLRPGRLTEIPDSKVGQLLTVLDRSGLPQQLEDMLRGRPGPPGVRPRTVLAGLMLAVYYTGRATVSDAWQILHFRLQPAARAWLGVPEVPPSTARACIAASRRLYRGLDRITTALDPARCDRRRRLGQAEADIHSAARDEAVGRAAANRLQRLANDLVLVPVRLAQQHGYMRRWAGDVGVDATSIPVLAKPDSDYSGTASVEITAGWHFSGGSDKGIFGYSASLLVAAHSRTGERAAKGRRAPSYPQLCLGLSLDTPTVRTGENAVTVLKHLAELRLPTGTCAADRACTGCSPENFQVPVRRLGYRLALDYKAADRGIQGSWQGAVLIDGSLTCPHIPNALAQATHGMDDKTFRRRLDELKPVAAERLPYFLKLKQNADARGTCACNAQRPARRLR
ncbi:hypothetical protein [Streptomyces sp. NPDC088923]|uniref:hypothetical protein n=1 Tax=Streptomyces sp. NPDC088923 TaxID=3365913 RepID=UPI00382F10D5